MTHEEPLDRDRLAEARENLEALAGDPSAPGHLKAKVQLGELLIRLGEHELALSHLAAVPPIGEPGEAASVLAGTTCVDRERYDEAASWLRQAIAIRPSAMAWCLLHAALFRNGEDDESLDCLLQALQLDDTYEEAHANLAMRYRLAGRLEEARAHADRALELDPDYAFALGEACALAIRVDPEEACRLGRRATQLDPSAYWAWLYFATAQWATGDVDGADHSYSQVRSLHPGDALAMRLHANFIRKALQDDDRATRVMEELVALHPDSDEGGIPAQKPTTDDP